MKPKSLTSALQSGSFICKSIYAKGSKKIRVSIQKRHHESDKPDFFDYWIDRDYFKRVFPNLYDKN